MTTCRVLADKLTCARRQVARKNCLLLSLGPVGDALILLLLAAPTTCAMAFPMACDMHGVIRPPVLG